MPSAIPTIDLAPFIDHSDKPGVSRAIARACEEIGFFTVVGHGVPAGLLSRLSSGTTRFFDLPFIDKELVSAPGGMGYIRVGGEKLAATLDDTVTGDYKESLNLMLPADAASWPADQALRADIGAYYREMLRVAGVLMHAFAGALDLPEAWFDDKVDHARTTLRLLNYPPMRELKPGMTWAGSHTDYGILTILWSADSSGLQARNRAGEWVDVAAHPNAFIINIGDLMMNWTNDRWISTLHRVVASERDLNRRRQSIPFFYNPNPDALIECLPSCQDAAHPPKYAPITAHDHLMMKINKAVAG